jgi:hypothetical protein
MLSSSVMSIYLISLVVRFRNLKQDPEPLQELEIKMDRYEPPLLLKPGSVFTACGGPALFSENTPGVLFHGEWTFSACRAA